MEQEYLNSEEHAAYMEDFSEVVNSVIEKVISIADKHNIDRDNVMAHFSTIFSEIVQVGIFEHFEEGGE